MHVRVFRKTSQSDSHVAVVDVDYIHNIHWGDSFGNGKFKHAGFSIYGYINYDFATQCGLNGGQHSYYGNGTKIKIRKEDNIDFPYINSYQKILEMIGTKPTVKYNLSVTGEATTARILRILQNKGCITRGELRCILLKENYSVQQIRNAIKRMSTDGRIYCFGGPNFKNQMIFIDEYDVY